MSFELRHGSRGRLLISYWGLGATAVGRRKGPGQSNLLHFDDGDRLHCLVLSCSELVVDTVHGDPSPAATDTSSGARSIAAEMR